MSSREINTGDDEYGDTPLHVACGYYNNVPAAAALLQTPGIEVNMKDTYGCTPIMLALNWCNKEVVVVMLRDIRVELGEEGLDGQVGVHRGTEQQKREIVILVQEERTRRREGRRDRTDCIIEEARGHLECPVCLQRIRPPTRIWQCPQSHLVCEPCRDRLQNWRCPCCRTEKVSQRSRLAENMARALFVLDQ